MLLNLFNVASVFFYSYACTFPTVIHCIDEEKGGVKLETVTWPVQQQFYFPEEVGVAHQVKDFSVVPIWEKMPRKESFRLTGIYRITATVLFEKGLCACEGILIDDLDVNDDAHYFEYGCPLEIDLPLRAYESILLQVKDNSANIQPDGTLIISFNVECNLIVNEPQDQPIVELPVREQKHEEMKQPAREQKHEEMKQPAREQKHEEMKQPVLEQKHEDMKQPELENEDKVEIVNEYPVGEEKEKVQLFVQEIEPPKQQHEFSFLHQLKEEYSLFSPSPK